VLIAAAGIVALLVADSDIEIYCLHCFLGRGHGRDTGKPTWAPQPFNVWADGNAGLDHQTTALFNLVFAFELSSSPTQPVDTLTIRLGTYYPGAVLRLRIQGQRAEAVPRGARRVFIPFAIEVVLDPTDATAGQASALEEGSVTIVTAGRELRVQARPRGPGRTGRVEDVVWRVTMDLGGNTAQNPAVPIGPGYPSALQGLIPGSGQPVTVGVSSSAKSIDF
jgi:hypothetical protein